MKTVHYKFSLTADPIIFTTVSGNSYSFDTSHNPISIPDADADELLYNGVFEEVV